MVNRMREFENKRIQEWLAIMIFKCTPQIMKVSQ